jgi:hypothetical protein
MCRNKQIIINFIYENVQTTIVGVLVLIVIKIFMYCIKLMEVQETFQSRFKLFCMVGQIL